jgi:hypothetical protein
MHLIDKHMFPKTYDFFIVNSGIDKRSSMLRPRHRKLSSAASRAFARDQKPTSSSKTSGGVQVDSASSLPDTPMISIDTAQGLSPDESAKHSVGPPKSADAAIEDLTSTMSELRFVPPSVRFGRGGRRGGLSRS